jgi:hypothetical protein
MLQTFQYINKILAFLHIIPGHPDDDEHGNDIQ